MEIPTQLVHALKSGEMSLLISEKETLQLKIEDKRINVNLLNKKLLKSILETKVESEEKSLLGRLPQLKSLAKQLKRNGLTVIVSYKGTALLTLGREADPKLSRLVIGSDAIEINSLSKLMQLLIYRR